MITVQLVLEDDCDCYYHDQSKLLHLIEDIDVVHVPKKVSRNIAARVNPNVKTIIGPDSEEYSRVTLTYSRPDVEIDAYVNNAISSMEEVQDFGKTYLITKTIDTVRYVKRFETPQELINFIIGADVSVYMYNSDEENIDYVIEGAF